MTEQTDNNESSLTIEQQNSKEIVEKEFELAIYDVIINESTGKEDYKRVSYEQPITVKAKSPAELKSKLETFSNCGQIAKVVRVLNEKVIQTGKQKQIDNKANSSSTLTTFSNAIPDANSLQISHNNHNDNLIQPLVQTKSKPRYFKVGDIDVKDDNGKIYQKQWMRLSDSEASNIRIVNDKNNSTINLIGKHIEMKRWVLVENTNENDDIENMEGSLI